MQQASKTNVVYLTTKSETKLGHRNLHEKKSVLYKYTTHENTKQINSLIENSCTKTIKSQKLFQSNDTQWSIFILKSNNLLR